jgi:hypothetical protein
MWYFEPDLPLSIGLGPVSSPPFRPDGDRVDATAGPIQHLSLAELDQDDLVQPIPNPGILPLPQSSPRGVSGPAAQLLRQVAPTATGAEHEHDPFQRGTIIDPLPDWRGSELVSLGGQVAMVAGRWVADLTVMASVLVTTIEVTYAGDTIRVPCRPAA